MPFAFILRFEENCVDEQISAGTNTRTRARVEEADADAQKKNYDALIKHSPRMGTRSITAVRAEQVDEDPSSKNYSAFKKYAPHMGTSTKTAAPYPRESSDVDRDFSPLSVIPPKRDFNLGTQTLTFTRAEGADSDPSRIQFQVIPNASNTDQ